MKCDACQEMLPAFFDQTLTELLRFETCDHLSGCNDCFGHAEKSGRWEIEFIRLNSLKVPDEWLKEWREIKPDSQNCGPVSLPAKSLQYTAAWKFWAAGSCLFLAALFVVFKYFPQKNDSSISVKNFGNSAEALKELQEIAGRLGIQMDVNGNAVYVPGRIIGPGVELKPFHAHLKFSSEEKIQSFEKWVFALKPEESFNTPSLWVLSFSRAQMVALLEGIKNKKIEVEGDFPTASKIPVFSGSARISFYIDRTFQPGQALLLFQHWHFHFELTNRLDLLERLKLRGAKIVYESPELWVFETPASNLKEIIEVVDSCSGLKTEFINTDLLPDSGKIPIRISVYLSGR